MWKGRKAQKKGFVMNGREGTFNVERDGLQNERFLSILISSRVISENT